jgi:hypothetical protein
MTTPAIALQTSDDHVFLLGRPPLSEFLNYVKLYVVGGQTANQGDLRREWGEANRHVLALEKSQAGIADNVPLPDVPPSLAALAAAVQADPVFSAAYQLLPTRIAYVELDRLVVYQKQIDLSYVAMLKTQLGTQPSAEDVFRCCIPAGPVAQQVQVMQTAANSFTFVSPSNDFRWLGAPILQANQIVGYPLGGHLTAAVALLVGYSANHLVVAHAEGRAVLGNGSHRAYALRDLGITHVPCVLQDVSSRDELELLGYGDVAPNAEKYLAAPRPPMLRDYFDPSLRKLVPVVRKRRQVKLSFGVETADVPG